MKIEKKVAEYDATLNTRNNVNLFTEDDITKSISRLKVGKAAGFDSTYSTRGDST